MPVPVLTVAQMREWEKATWATGVSERDVIERVGRVIAQRLMQLTRPGDTVLILAGKGHNGDDARAALKHLDGREVQLIDAANPTTALGELERCADALSKEKIDNDFTAPPRCAQGGARSIIVDALFGIGLNRPLDSDWVKFVEKINAAGLPIFAIDVPSGLNAETGKPEGAAIRAQITLTVGAPKMGMLRASEFVGRLEVADDVGLIPCPLKSDLKWTLPSDFTGVPPHRAVETNKGTYGHAVLFAGSVGYHGAAVLMTRAAQRAQPGLVTVFTQEDVYVPVASQLQAAMPHPWTKEPTLPRTASAIGFGPGLAAEDFPETEKDFLKTLWQKSPLPVVADASALAWLEPGAIPNNTLRVITPHPGEAAKMLGVSTQVVQADRVNALRELSRRFGNCYVVLKGHQTLVGRSEGDVFINGTGNPYLAQGGSGDTLTGFLTGLVAQAELQIDPLKAIRYAVWEHGAAADRLFQQRSNWTVEDLIDELGRKLLSL